MYESELFHFSPIQAGTFNKVSWTCLHIRDKGVYVTHRKQNVILKRVNYEILCP